TAFGFAMPVLAGHPETALHVTLVGISAASAIWIRSHFDLRFLARFVAAATLAVGLAAIQLVPTLEWLAQMPSALDSRWPLLPLHQLFAWVSRDVIRGPNSAGVWIPEGAAYVGMITLLAASFAVFGRDKRHGIFLA